MSREALEKLVDRWINDPAFRVELRKDPETAIRGTGAELTDDEWQALRSMDPAPPDEPLQPRITK